MHHHEAAKHEDECAAHNGCTQLCDDADEFVHHVVVIDSLDTSGGIGVSRGSLFGD